MQNLSTHLCCAWITIAATTSFAGLEPAAAPAPAPPTIAAPAPAAPAAPVTLPGVGAKINFATPVYDFGRVKAGEIIKYSYVFTNSGDAPLEVTTVQPSCGCTTAGDWSRKVMPGQTGQVPIQFNSGHVSGAIFKTVSITSNDRQRPVVVLQLKGTLWQALEVLPSYTMMTVPPDVTGASAVIRIVNNTEEPLTLSAPEINTRSFTATIKTNVPGKEYQLSLASVGTLSPGNIQGKVSFKTSWTNPPTLDVPFYANVQLPISVQPPRISLPRAPLATKAPSTVKIQNNSTNAFTLSNPSVNVPGVDVQLQEVSPGRVYNALLMFPQGFELPTGQAVNLTVRSSNPRAPEISVPVVQPPRPAVPPPPIPKPPQPAASAAASTAAGAQAVR